MGWIAEIVPVVVTGVVGVAGIVAASVNTRYQAKAAVAAEERRHQFEAASELLALAYDVRDLVSATIGNREMALSRRLPDVEGHVARARRLAAQCMAISDHTVAYSAFALSDAIAKEIADLDEWSVRDPDRVFLSYVFVERLIEFETACRAGQATKRISRRAKDLDLPR